MSVPFATTTPTTPVKQMRRRGHQRDHARDHPTAVAGALLSRERGTMGYAHLFCHWLTPLSGASKTVRLVGYLPNPTTVGIGRVAGCSPRLERSAALVNDHEAREKVDELLDEADELTRAEHFEEALVKADAAAEIAAEAGIPPGSALCLATLNARAICLGELGDPDGEQATLLRIFELSEGSVDPEVLLERRVAAANRANNSRQAGDTERALSMLRTEILPWNPAPTDFGVEIYIRGARQAAHCLAAEGDNRAALELLEDVAHRYREVTTPVARLNLAMVIATEADICVNLDHVELAIAAYDRLLLGIGDLSDLELRLEAARALYARGYYKNVAGDADGAAKDNRDLLARFPPAEHDVIDRLRGRASDSLSL